MQAQALMVQVAGLTADDMATKKPRRDSPESREIKSVFVKRLRAWRDAKGMTQLDLAYNSGLSMDTLRSYEVGRRSPRLPEIADLAKALGVMPEVLIFRDPPKAKDSAKG